MNWPVGELDNYRCFRNKAPSTASAQPCEVIDISSDDDSLVEDVIAGLSISPKRRRVDFADSAVAGSSGEATLSHDDGPSTSAATATRSAHGASNVTLEEQTTSMSSTTAEPSNVRPASGELEPLDECISEAVRADHCFILLQGFVNEWKKLHDGRQLSPETS